MKDDGDAEARDAVMQRVEDIIAKEDKKKPLSDQKIADALVRQGVKIALRTVTKYRKILEIPNSRKRKEWVS